jgi:hypothetical protein
VLKTAGKQGELKKRITVTSNDPEKRNLTLEIKVTIVVDVMIEPRRVSFKQLDKGAEATELLNVTVSEPERIKVASMEVDDPRFELKLTSGELATESRWELKFKGSDKVESIEAKILVKYTAADKPETLEVPVRANVVGDLQFVKSIHFGKNPTTGFSEREVRLSSRSGRTVKITKTEDPDGLLKVDVTTPAGNPAVLKATVADPNADFPKPSEHFLKVHTDDKDQPVVEIKYMITNRAPGRGALPRGLAGRKTGALPLGPPLPGKGDVGSAPSAE